MNFINVNYESLKIDSFEVDEKFIFDEIYKIANVFQQDINRYKLFELALSHVNEWKYAIGGANIQRGFYSPLLYETMTIGGCNRGRKIKKITSKSKIEYSYGFNNDALIIAKKFDDIKRDTYTYEYIEKKENIEIGVEYAINRGKSDIGFENAIQIIVAQYSNGKLLNTRVLQEPDYVGGKIVDWYYSKSWYYYDEKNHLSCIENVCGIRQVMQQKKVIVICDEKGCPNQYYYDGGNKTYKVSENDKAYYREVFL